MSAEAPTEMQLKKLIVFAMVAWDDVIPINAGFRATKRGGIEIYVKQGKGGRNAITQEGPDTAALLASIERFFCLVAKSKLNVDESFVRGIVEKSMAQLKGEF